MAKVLKARLIRLLERWRILATEEESAEYSRIDQELDRAARVDAEFIDTADFFDDSGELTDPGGAAAADRLRRSDDDVDFVDDGLGEEFEAELDAWEANRD